MAGPHARAKIALRFVPEDTRREPVAFARLTSVASIESPAGTLIVASQVRPGGEPPSLIAGIEGRVEAQPHAEGEVRSIARVTLLAFAESGAYREFPTRLYVLGPDRPELRVEALRICGQWSADVARGEALERLSGELLIAVEALKAAHDVPDLKFRRSFVIGADDDGD